MDIILKVSGEEALSWQDRLRRAQHSKAPLKSLLYVIIRQAVKAQAKIELDVLQKETEAATADVPRVETEGKNEAME